MTKSEKAKQYPKTAFSSSMASRINFLVGAIGFAVIMVVVRRPELFEWPHFVSIFVAVAIVTGIGVLTGLGTRSLNVRVRVREQQRRDERSKRILEDVRSGSAGDYSLYLRAFGTTALLQDEADANLHGSGFSPTHPDDQLVDFETSLAKAVEDHFPLVALGEPGEHTGAGRIKCSDTEWQSLVALLASRATVIFVVPADTAGTLWEIDWLQSHGYFAKSIFTLPPTSRHTKLDIRESWDAVRSQCAVRNIMLPEYASDGMLFFLSKDGSRVATENTLVGGPKYFDVRITQLMKDYARHLTGRS